MKGFKSIFVISILIGNQTAIASSVNCPNVNFKSVTIEGKRDDGFEFENKLIIKLDQPCSGKDYVHLEISNSSYNSFLSTALAVKLASKKVTIGVNTSIQTSLSNQLAYIEVSE